MHNWNNFFVKCGISAALLLAPCKAFVCADYDPESWRFWLFQPDVAGVTDLLPFTYTSERFYKGSEPETDTTNYLVNAREWQSLLGASVKENDIYQMLYKTPPANYFAGDYRKNNSFIQALQQSKNAELLDYLNFAKQCEQAMSGSNKQANLQKTREAGRVLFDKTNNPFAKLRCAYLLLKLDGYLGDQADLKQQLDYVQKNAPAGAWVRDQALYNYALAQTADPQRNYCLSLAFDGCRWNKAWTMVFFRSAGLPKALRLAKNDHERAVLETMAALQYPGRALDRLERIYRLEPAYPALSMLLAREVNKLENWLLTQQLTGSEARFELPWDQQEKATREGLLRADLAYLHQLDQFVNRILATGKSPDAAFWRLSAAHLMLLDGDFIKTREHLQQISAPGQLPARLQIQVRITDLLTELLENKTIKPETENKIPDIFALIDQQKSQIPDADILKSQIALYLSDAFIRKGSIGKGVLLLSKTNQEWSSPFGNRVCYYKLLEVAKPADYDALLALLDGPKVSPFDRWLTADPVAFDFDPWDGDWDSGEFVPAKHPDAKWDTNKIREFKARYYIWEDRLDSAYVVLNDIPVAYWAGQDSAETGYFKNPFSVGIEIPDLALSGEKVDFGRDQAKFVKKMIDLQNEAEKDPAKKQLNYILLGNAYFNMSWMGRWWNMYHTQRSSVEFADVRRPEAAAPPKTGQNKLPRTPWLFGLGMLGLLTAGLFRRRRGAGILLTTASLLLLCGLWNCTRSTPVQTTLPAWTPTVSADFDAAYYCCDRAKVCYGKALDADPNKETAILAAYMGGLCQQAREVYDYKKTHPEDYMYDQLDGKIKFTPNPYLSKLPADLKYMPAVSCAVFSSFLKKEDR